MIKFIGKRIAMIIPVAFLVSVFSFALIHFAPGDPALFYIVPGMTEEQEKEIRASMGLDDSVVVQYGKWIIKVAHGDLGYSIYNKRSVSRQITEKLPATLLIMAGSIIFSVIVSVGLGMIAGYKKGTKYDKSIMFLTNIGISLPEFWFGIILILIFSLKLKWLPGSGMHTTGVDSIFDVLKHAILPIVTLSIGKIAVYTRYIRANVIKEMKEDYVMTALAKGTSEEKILMRHVLKNCLLPIITLVGMNMGSLVSGSYIIESIFGWPGLGNLGLNAITNRDYPLIMGTVMLACMVLIVGNLLADVCYCFADPRIRMEGKR